MSNLNTIGGKNRVIQIRSSDALEKQIAELMTETGIPTKSAVIFVAMKELYDRRVSSKNG